MSRKDKNLSALGYLEDARDALTSAESLLEGDNGECENCEGRDRVFDKLRTELRYIDGLNQGQVPRGRLAIAAILEALVELGMDDAPILWGEATRLKRVRPEY